MRLDNLLVFSDDQDDTTVTTHVSDSVVDLGVGGDAIGRELWLDVHVTTKCTSDGAATLAAALYTSADEAFGTSTLLVSGATIALANLDAGDKVLVCRVPPGALRYLRITYTIGTAALTAGKWSAQLVDGIDASFARS